MCDENRLDRADNVGICTLEANAIETDVLDRPFLWKIFFEIREDSWVSFDGFMMAMGIDKIIEKNMPTPGSNREYKAWRYIEALCLPQYGADTYLI